MVMSLTKRQDKILEGVCREYIQGAVPISSQFLKQKQCLDFSPATIRAEFVKLEEKNYLIQPYISSGRVPTDRGFRFFVDRILESEDLKVCQEDVLEEVFSEISKIKDLVKTSQQVAKNLSLLSSNLVFTYIPQQDIVWKEGWDIVVREPEFQNVQYLKDFAKAVSNFEKNINELDWDERSIKVYIGKELPCLQKDISVVMIKSHFLKDIDGMIAILGPKRMDFEKNIGVLSKINEIFNSF